MNCATHSARDTYDRITKTKKRRTDKKREY